MTDLRTIRFGIEIETIKAPRHVVAAAIQSVVGGVVRHVGTPHCYDPWHVIADDGRKWTVMKDSSLSAVPYLQAEIVSPILHYSDIETLQKVIRAARRAGARVDGSCGIHIHLDGANFGPKALVNLTKIMNKQEHLLDAAIGLEGNRKARWAKGVNQTFLRKVEAMPARERTMEALNVAWYGRLNLSPRHYDPSRYHGLNLHNVWFRGTVEFRHFNATLHAGKVKAFIQLALGIGAKAINARSASSKRRPFSPETSKYDFRCFLLSIGLIGDEFKTARLHLLANLDGDAAYHRAER